MAETVQIGIVGIGGYGRLLLNQLLEEQQQETLRIAVAVVSFPEQDAEHLAYLKEQSPETTIFQTLEEAAAAGADLDLMFLPVGIGAHKTMTEFALAAGWNVLVEKPLAGSIEEAENIVQAAELSDRFVAVGYQDMYGPVPSAMKQALLSGEIGNVHSIRVLGIWGRSAEYFRRNAWAGKLVYDGTAIYDSPFNNAMAHYLNLALFLAGPEQGKAAVPIAVDGSLWRTYDIESCDTACLCWQTENGPDVSIFFSHASLGNADPELVAEGTKGSLRWKFQSHWELLRDGHDPVQHSVPPVDSTRLTMIRQLTERIHNPQIHVYTPHQALAQVRATALAHEQIAIQTAPASRVTRHITANKDGQVSEWLDITGMEKAGRSFLEGDSNFRETCRFFTETYTADAVC